MKTARGALLLFADGLVIIYSVCSKCDNSNEAGLLKDGRRERDRKNEGDVNDQNTLISIRLTGR